MLPTFPLGTQFSTSWGWEVMRSGVTFWLRGQVSWVTLGLSKPHCSHLRNGNNTCRKEPGGTP